MSYTYGDTKNVYVKGASDIRFGIDIRGGVDVTFMPADDVEATDAQMTAAKTVIEDRLVGLGITDYGVNLLIISIGFNPGGTAPIFTPGELTAASWFVDPIPQALTLTSIVIGACTTAMALALVMKLEESYGTIDTREIRRLRG